MGMVKFNRIRVCRATLKGVPANVKGLEVRSFKHLLHILKWVQNEVTFIAEGAKANDFLICFYVEDVVDGVSVLHKVEAQIEKVEFLKEVSF